MANLRILWPIHQNNVQRSGFAATLILVVLLVFLHNPFDGYRTEKLATYTEWKAKGCAENDKQQMTELLPRQDQQSNFRYQELFRKCIEVIEHTKFEDLPFEEWSSQMPHVFWLGSVVHLLEALFTSVAIGIIWVFVFATAGPSKEQGNA